MSYLGGTLELPRFDEALHKSNSPPSHLVPTQEIESGALAKAFKPTAFTVCGLIFQCADLL